MDFMFALLPWITALHVISVIAWMAALLYLPRLYVYHAQVAPGSETSETFKVMERRLLKAIGTPAMIAALIFGLILLGQPGILEQGWVHAKLLLLLGMFLIHGLYAKWRKDFEADRNTRTHTFYRWMNEVPTILMIAIVLLAVAKPF
ncbi:protoporphyrinogen oxidase HemJ [Algihabitans albus]|uniref:protoporphyrinogen oxidase HemJ n=1 Tax=Algihabitans albus TaxID=2164067 RepID=UPI000E5D9A1E|nr:protoporphyrinogen oxidase HemJ [Algihabitans albus]